jgi:hypothetical protein
MIRELKPEDSTEDVISEFSKGDKVAEMVLTRLLAVDALVLIALSQTNLRGENIANFYRIECGTDPLEFIRRVKSGDIPPYYLTA